MNMFSQFITPGVVFLLTLIFGFWLGEKGKPYNGILFNIHKLIGLGTVIITTMQIYGVLKNTEISSLLIVSIIIAGICVVTLFASGAFLSIGNLNYKFMKAIHNVALVLAVIAMALTVYFLTRKTF